MRWALMVLVAPHVLARPVAGQDEPVEWRLENIAGVKPAAAQMSLHDLQRNVASGDRRAVCAMAEYPLRHTLPGAGSRRMPNPLVFLFPLFFVGLWFFITTMLMRASGMTRRCAKIEEYSEGFVIRSMWLFGGGK